MGNPVFDPNQSYEVVEDKPKFDPTQPYEAVDEQPEQKPKFDPSQPYEEVKPEEPISSLGQQAATVAEGAAGPLGTLAETAPVPEAGGPVFNAMARHPLTAVALLAKEAIGKINPEEIKARAEAHPIEHAAGEFGTLVTNPELEIPKILGNVGSHAINAGITGGALEGANEYQKALLGQGDPTSVVAAKIAGTTAASALFGAATSTLGKGGNWLLKQAENQKWGTRLKSWLAGVGHGVTFPEEAVAEKGESALDMGKRISDAYEKSGMKGTYDPKIFSKGQEWGLNVPRRIVRGAALPVAIKSATNAGLGTITGVSMAEQMVESLLTPQVTKATKAFVGPAILKAAASGKTEHIYDIINHATKVAKGAALINKGVEACFQAGQGPAIDASTSDKENELIKKYIDDGGSTEEINQAQQTPAYAQGGEVTPSINQPNPIADIWPEQNVMLSATKSRVSNYLNSVKPQANLMKLPYDSKHKDHQKERDYDHAIGIANKPLGVLNKIKKGNLLPKDVSALNSMYPELHQHLSQKLLERIHQGQLKGEEKPPYKVRQALSLFLGSNLDSSLSQPNMMAAQNVFQMQKAQKQLPQNPGKALGQLGKNSQTPDQSREQRLNKS